MKKDERQDIVLSEICCQCLKGIQDVYYALVYGLLSLREYRVMQERFRNISPQIQTEGDWLRIRYEGMGVAFSISDDAINLYKPIIQEFQCFGSAVRVLSMYENYIKRIVEIADHQIPDKMIRFRSIHNIRSGRTTAIKSFWSNELGRGIDFLQEVFGWNPSPHYKPGLKLWFHLRNLTVHNNGIADDKLCQLARNPHIESVGNIKAGDKASWNIGNTLQLPQFIILILTDADPYVFNNLNLPTRKQQPFWRVDNALTS